MKKAVSAFGLIGVVLLSGCSEEVKTRDWYMDHPKELAEVFAKCKASGNDTQNCRNAIAANFRVQQTNAAIPKFNDSKSEIEIGDVKPFKTYKVNGLHGSFEFVFPESLNGKTIADIKNNNYTLSEAEKLQVQDICEKSKKIVNRVLGENGRAEQSNIDYTCKLFNFN